MAFYLMPWHAITAGYGELGSNPAFPLSEHLASSLMASSGTSTQSAITNPHKTSIT